jgi:hypothetical protein
MEYIPYKQSVALNELGYNYEVEFYKDDSEQLFDMRTPNDAPCILWQQAFRFFRKKYGMVFNLIGSGPYYPSISFKSTDGESEIELGEFETYEEAELEYLKKIIEITKNK